MMLSLAPTPGHYLDSLPPYLQLWYAGFVVPDFLLAAYAASGREEFSRPPGVHRVVGSIRESSLGTAPAGVTFVNDSFR